MLGGERTKNQVEAQRKKGGKETDAHHLNGG